MCIISTVHVMSIENIQRNELEIVVLNSAERSVSRNQRKTDYMFDCIAGSNLKEYH